MSKTRLMEDLVTDVRLAEAFGLSVETLHRLRQRHGWPLVKLGRVVRFTEAQVDEIIRAHTVEPSDRVRAEGRLRAAGLTPRSAAYHARRR